MNPENVVLSGGSQSQRAHSVKFHLYETPRTGKFMETESVLMAVRAWGGRGGVNVNKGGISFGGNENVSELERAAGCIAL